MGEKELMSDLEKYGHHLQGCKANIGLRAQVFYNMKPEKCNCGFLEALEQAKAADKQQITRRTPCQT